MFLFVNNHQGRKCGRNKKTYLLDTVSLFLFSLPLKGKEFLFVSLFVCFCFNCPRNWGFVLINVWGVLFEGAPKSKLISKTQSRELFRKKKGP